MLRQFPLISCVVLLLATGSVHAQKKTRSLELGEALAQTCMACHGSLGGSLEQAIPTIGGQIETYLVETMKAYREGTRPSGVMNRIAIAYSNREIEAIAYYFSRLPFVRPPQPTNPDKVVLGQTIHSRKCSKCHLHNGRDTSVDGSPLLAGQKLGYLQRNMAEILAEKRVIEIKMNASLQELTREEIDATLHFYAAQHGEVD